MDVWDYFKRREREFAEMSVDGRRVEFYEEEGSDGQRGRLIGDVYFNEDVYLAIHERIEVVGSTVERTEYAYYLIMGGAEYWGYELDPTHEPALHRHTYGHHESYEADAVSFKQVCDMAWREISLQADTE